MWFLSQYSYFNQSVPSNSDILRQYSKKRSVFPKTQRQMTFLTVYQTPGKYPFVILQAPFMQMNPTQKKISPQDITPNLQMISFHFSHFQQAIITLRLPAKQKTKTGQQAQKASSYHSPVDRQLKTEKKPMSPAMRTGMRESSMKYNFSTSCQGAICRFEMTEMRNPAKTKVVMSFPLSSELTPRSRRMQALRQVSVMGMERLRKQNKRDWLFLSLNCMDFQSLCLTVSNLCFLNYLLISYSCSISSIESLPPLHFLLRFIGLMFMASDIFQTKIFFFLNYIMECHNCFTQIMGT